MEFKNPISIQCPFCSGEFRTDRDFVSTNKRVMCNNCCKAFDIDLPKEDPRYEDWDSKRADSTEDFGYWNGY